MYLKRLFVLGKMGTIFKGNHRLCSLTSGKNKLTLLKTNVNVVKCSSYGNKANRDDKLKHEPLTSNLGNLTHAQKLKKAVTTYGSTVIVFHVGISLLSLGSCYLLVSSGLDVEQCLAYLNLDNWIKGRTVLVSNAGTFAVAYAIHKIFAPVRITITLASVPFIVKYLRHKGILKK